LSPASEWIRTWNSNPLSTGHQHTQSATARL